LVGDRLLLAGEHIDGKPPRLDHGGQAARLAADAEQDEGRIDGDGIERAHGHADQLVALAARGHDRNTGRKLSERSPESTVLHRNLRRRIWRHLAFANSFITKLSQPCQSLPRAADPCFAEVVENQGNRMMAVPRALLTASKAELLDRDGDA